MKQVIIIGGGLAGLTCALLLNRRGFEVSLIEKKAYPFHRVCGEYVSNEVLPFLAALDIDLKNLGASSISRLEVSSVSGRLMKAALPLGGSGISRYRLDHYLYQKALSEGVQFIFDKVTDIAFADECFTVKLSGAESRQTPLLIAAYGKRSNLDQKLGRIFFYRRSPYMAVKYHIRTDFPGHTIRLDNFEGGYCGICSIEDGKYNLCYLAENRQLKKYGSIRMMEQEVLYRNPHLAHMFKNSDFLLAKPEVINEISFERKSLVEDHILFCGDAAGMITPLCGNGMAMAIRSAKILADCLSSAQNPNIIQNRLQLEHTYRRAWEKEFSLRLASGRLIQNLLSMPLVGGLLIGALQKAPALTQILVKKTHGKAFK